MYFSRTFANMRCFVFASLFVPLVVALSGCSPDPQVAEVRSFSLLKDAIPGNPYKSSAAGQTARSNRASAQDPLADLIASSSASLVPAPLPDFGAYSAQRDRIMSAMRRMDQQFDVQKRPRRTPKEWVKRPWDHSLPFLLADQKADYSSDYGWRSLWGRKDFHGGIDIMAKKGTPIFAVTDGVLEYAENAGRNGGLVLRGQGRDQGYHFTYWHIQPSGKLHQGQQVRKGQLLGRIANWGANSHLHYAVHATDGQTYKARSDKASLHPLIYHRARETAAR
jgi:murein DD-endopeptidase MepM/ murein hydrolase activator NlpD